MKKEYSRIPWDKWPKAVTDMETGTDGKRRDVSLDDFDKRIITLDTSKFENR